MLFEEHSQWLLVVHTVLAFATLAISTHLVLWLRPYLRGVYGNQRGVRRFAAWSVATYVATMLFGLALYPTYRVRVRAEYLDNPSAITRSVEAKARAEATARRHNEESRSYRLGETPRDRSVPQRSAEEIAIEAEQSVKRGVHLSRWFDVKEHWSALGLLMSVGLLFILSTWDPKKGREGIRYVVLGLAISVALSTWAAALIGLLSASARSVTSL